MRIQLVCKEYLLVFVTLVLPAVGRSAGTIGKDVFPLMAWDYADDEATLRAMSECGINMVAFVPPKALDTCERLGVKAIVFDPEVTPARWDQPFKADRAAKALPELVKQVNDHPSVYGYHLKDE